MRQRPFVPEVHWLSLLHVIPPSKRRLNAQSPAGAGPWHAESSARWLTGTRPQGAPQSPPPELLELDPLELELEEPEELEEPWPPEELELLDELWPPEELELLDDPLPPEELELLDDPWPPEEPPEEPEPLDEPLEPLEPPEPLLEPPDPLDPPESLEPASLASNVVPPHAKHTPHTQSANSPQALTRIPSLPRRLYATCTPSAVSPISLLIHSLHDWGEPTCATSATPGSRKPRVARAWRTGLALHWQTKTVAHCQCPADAEYEHTPFWYPEGEQSLSSMHSSESVWQ
jgi:hypothetical protein